MNYEYDANKDKCPLPLVKLRVILKKMVAGDTCLLTIKDSGSKQDILRNVTTTVTVFLQKYISKFKFRFPTLFMTCDL